MNYSEIEPIQSHIPAARQEAKRHYGVHPYFTRRPYNVVREYIKHYSREGDIVLDPFGGSGVTAVEAYLENRIGIQNDINPLANFISKGLVELPQAKEIDISSTFAAIEARCKNALLKVQEGKLTSKYLPPNVALPKTSDVDRYHDLFTNKQLYSLAVLKEEIDTIKPKEIRTLFLLAWSGALARLNKTFISTQGRAESRGGSSIFSIYRYKVAQRPIELDAWQVFENRVNSVLRARREIIDEIELKKKLGGWSGKFECYSLDVIDLGKKYDEEVDYIFTDPPYGGHISYIDLSTLWNVWLGIEPTKKAHENELIVGGEMGLTEEYYIQKLSKSVNAMFRMLRNRRWLSVVFQHWNVEYFKAILRAAEESGAELRAAVSQIGDPIWSMHKKKGKSSVLAGEMILTFFKDKNKQQKERRTGKAHIDDIVNQLLADSEGKPLYGEMFFNKLIIETWHHGIIDELKITKTDLSDMLEKHGWLYNEHKHEWQKTTQQHSLDF